MGKLSKERNSGARPAILTFDGFKPYLQWRYLLSPSFFSHIRLGDVVARAGQLLMSWADLWRNIIKEGFSKVERSELDGYRGNSEVSWKLQGDIGRGYRPNWRNRETWFPTDPQAQSLH